MTMTRLFTQLFAIVLGMVLIAGAAPAPDRPTSADPSLSAARRALEQQVTLETSDSSLPIVLAQLGEQAKVTIVLDRASIQQMGLDPNDLPVAARLKDVKLKVGLRTIASQHNLAVAAVGDTIILTTAEVALQRLLRQSVDVDAAGQPLAEALKRLARLTGPNIVIDPRQAKAGQVAVTLQVEDVPLETAVRLLSELAGLKPARVGNVLFVTNEERADKLKNDGDLVPVSTPTGPIAMPPPAAPIAGGVVVPPPPVAPPAPATPPVPAKP
jgi:hypothetical protein